MKVLLWLRLSQGLVSLKVYEEFMQKMGYYIFVFRKVYVKIKKGVGGGVFLIDKNR